MNPASEILYGVIGSRQPLAQSVYLEQLRPYQMILFCLPQDGDDLEGQEIARQCYRPPDWDYQPFKYTDQAIVPIIDQLEELEQMGLITTEAKTRSERRMRTVCWKLTPKGAEVALQMVQP